MIQQQILGRVRTNLACAEKSGVEVLRVEAGWCAILRLPRLMKESDLAEALLREQGVVVHSGSLYGIPESGRIVVSLIGLTAEFVAGMEGIAAFIGENRIS